MTSVLVLGATGMLGHALCRALNDRYETWAAARSEYARYSRHGIFDPKRFISGTDAFDFGSVVRAFAIARPQVAVNCIGIVKQLPAANDPVSALTVNALFPHHLADLCQAAGTRLIHISSDCVFSGRKGNYTEDDPSDAEDLYGQTKYLGELRRENCLTLRTSIIGRELASANGLVEWFLSQEGGTVEGYARAMYSGLTTPELADVITNLIEKHRDLSGLFQVSGETISKFELLLLLRDAYGLDVTIRETDHIRLDRTLSSVRFRSETGYHPPSWPEMVRRLASGAGHHQRRDSGAFGR